MIIKAVIDTNVLVSAMLSPNGIPAKIWDAFLNCEFALCYCSGILEEYRDVLARPRLAVNRADADDALAAVEVCGILISVTKSILSIPDEDDRLFYDTAVSAGALLVTGNTKHFPRESIILSPASFWDKLHSE
jgi:putative PIN family toxin of toxin-antitoxin system